MNRYVCIHGHFYQPPRENPWLEAVELQDSAYPFHDWNCRITSECYAPNAASRILGHDRKIIDLVNNYSHISFNFGPTLLSWMERAEPETYRLILEADQISRDRFNGHGSALAQAYNHMILPLASARDKRTQIRWGIEDFRYRFGRDPEGMWLPETAVDLETLDLLADCGIAFTVLAPRQAARARASASQQWRAVEGGQIDPRRAYRCRLPSGGQIALFFYDGPISRAIAFERLLQSGERLADRLIGAFADTPDPQLVHIATDGETYGHHHRHGDMALAYCLHHLRAAGAARITVYGQYLELHPPQWEVEVFERSSWSCVHGVERWRADCGCNSGMHPGWHQSWRAPLRGALDWLRDNTACLFEQHAGGMLRDVWAARDDYICIVLDRSEAHVDAFLQRHGTPGLVADDAVKALQLLELQRNAMLMYTSCGWFFDDVSGIESVQILTYAARVLQLARSATGVDLEDAFVALLRRCPGNLPVAGDGATVYERYVRPAITDILRVGGHYAVSCLFRDYPETSRLYTYTVQSRSGERHDLGRHRLVLGSVLVRSEVTREETLISFAVLHLGDHNISGGARYYTDAAAYTEMIAAFRERFLRGEVSEVFRLIGEHFSDQHFSLWHLFRDEQRQILQQIFEAAQHEAEESFRRIYENHYATMQAVSSLNQPLPGYFPAVVELIVNADMRRVIESESFDHERLHHLVEEARTWSLTLDRARLSLSAGETIAGHMERLCASPGDRDLMDNIVAILQALSGLALELDLWKAQNMFFAIGTRLLASKRRQAARGRKKAREWVESFRQLGDQLHIRIE